jgi:hypothetical protein
MRFQAAVFTPSKPPSQRDLETKNMLCYSVGGSDIQEFVKFTFVLIIRTFSSASAQ